MEPGKADEYIAQKMKLRDRLFAVNYPVTRISFNDYLVQGLPEEWETFKITMRGVSRKYTENEMIATIRDEDIAYRRKMESEKAYAANSPPQRRSIKGNSSNSDRQTPHCSHCNKDGHTASKCWNKPPYYCPKCKAQGHALGDCSGKGKQKTYPGGNTQGKRQRSQAEAQKRGG